MNFHILLYHSSSKAFKNACRYYLVLFLILEKLAGPACVRRGIFAVVESREFLQFLLLKPPLLSYVFANTWAGFNVQEPAKAR